MRKGHEVGGKPDGGRRRENIGSPGQVFLEDIVLNRTSEGGSGDTLSSGRDQVECKQSGRRRIDGHGSRHRVKRDSPEKAGHVLDGIDGDARAANLCLSQRMIRVES